MQGPPPSLWDCPCGARNGAAFRNCSRCGQPRPGYACPPPAGQAQLWGASPGLAGRAFPLPSARACVVGRDPGCDVCIPDDPSLSGRHFQVLAGPTAFALDDLSSANGTFVNGQRVTGGFPLKDGDVLQAGNQQFRFAAVPPQPVYPPPPQYGAYAGPYGGGYASPAPPPGGREKVPAGLFALLLGPFGAHLFYLHHTGWAIAYLMFTICTCGYGTLITGPLSMVQGIMYLVCNDWDFHQKYVVEHRFM